MIRVVIDTNILVSAFLQPQGSADLVTGNLKHSPPQWAATSIVTARQFLSALAEIQEEPR
jgi:hypothetical protein